MSDDIEKLIKSAFNAFKKEGEKAEQDKLSLGMPIPKGANIQESTEGLSKVPDTQEGMIAEMKDVELPEGVPESFRSDYLALVNACAMFTAGFMAINTAHDPKNEDDESFRQKLYIHAQRLCNRALAFMRMLQHVHIEVGAPKPNGAMIVSIAMKRKEKK